MSISSEITRITNAIADAYNSVDEKGGTLPVVQNSANLPNAIASIPSGSGFPSVFFYGDDLTSSGSVTMTGQGRSYSGVWGSKTNPSYHNLPSGYQELDGIISTGSQYIDTGFAFTQNVGKVVLDFTPSDFNNNNRALGIYNTDASPSQVIISARNFASSNRIICGIGNTSAEVLSGATIQKYNVKIEFDGNNYCFDANGTSVSGTMSGTVVSGYNIYISAMNDRGSATRKASQTTHEVYIEENGIAKLHLIPCKRLSDNVVSMFDLVNNNFLIPVGTFTSGEVVPQYIYGFVIDKIKSFGTYSYAATQSGSTSTGTLLIDAVENYSVEVTI